MKNLYLFVLLTLLISACSNTKQSAKKREVSHGYDCEYFSIDYPSDWIAEEYIDNMCDTIDGLSKGIEVKLTPKRNKGLFHSLRIQKSAMFYVFDTPEKWRDLSMEFKQNDETYLGYIDLFIKDSLDFKGYPAAMTGFVFSREPGDTIVQKQLVVMVDSTIFYLDNVFDWNDDGTLEDYGDSILYNIRFKK